MLVSVSRNFNVICKMAENNEKYVSPTMRSTIKFHEGGLSDDSMPFSSKDFPLSNSQGTVSGVSSSQLINHEGGLAAPAEPYVSHSAHPPHKPSTLVNSSTGLGALAEAYTPHSSGDHTKQTHSSISQCEKGLEGTQDSRDNLLIAHHQFGEGEVVECKL